MVLNHSMVIPLISTACLEFVLGEHIGAWQNNVLVQIRQLLWQLLNIRKQFPQILNRVRILIGQPYYDLIPRPFIIQQVYNFSFTEAPQNLTRI